MFRPKYQVAIRTIQEQYYWNLPTLGFGIPFGGRSISLKLNRIQMARKNNSKTGIKMPMMTFLLGLFVILSAHQAMAESENGSGLNIEDVIQRQHFLAFTDFYTNGQRKYLCVETEPHLYALWNPVDDSLSAPSPKSDCGAGSKFHSPFNLVQMAPMHDESSFSGATSIHRDDNSPANNCGSNLRTFYTVTYRNGIKDSFYIVARLRSPMTFEIGAMCDAPAQKIVQQFDTPLMLCSTDLGNGKTLIFSYEHRYAEPILLLIKTLPKSVWASEGRNLFIVPASRLSHALSWKTSGDLGKRYKALMDQIKE